MIIHPNMPRRTEEQRLEALRRANRIRSAQAQVRRDIARGLDPELAPAVAAYPPELVRTMKVRRVLLALPGVGPSKVDRFMHAGMISQSKTLGGLSDRQRELVVDFCRSATGRRCEECGMPSGHTWQCSRGGRRS